MVLYKSCSGTALNRAFSDNASDHEFESFGDNVSRFGPMGADSSLKVLKS
jgi:hypothetical protein